MIFVFLFLTSLCMTDSKSIYLTTNNLISFLFRLRFHYIYVSHLLYPFICPWTFRLLPSPGYCIWCCNEHCGACLFFFSIIKTIFFLLFIFLYSRFLLVIYFIHMSVYMSIPIAQFITPPPPPPAAFPPWCPYICSLHVYLSFCPANRFICTIFLRSTYMH